MTTKIFKFSLFLGLCLSFSSMLQGQCIECLDEPFEEVCVEDADGNIIPFPNECFAECAGFTSDDYVDCDIIFGNPCDCPGDFDPVCVDDGAGNQLFFPNACFAECEGFTSDDFVDCENTGDDCIECWDEPTDPVCVETEPGLYCPFPNACFAECAGYSVDDFVDCDSIGLGGGGGGLPCDCGFEFDPVCVEDEDGNILFFPNLCWAECEGYTEDDLVDCEEPPVDDCIECLDEPLDPVCVETEPGIYCPFPNACYAECEGYTEDDFVDCDSIGIGGGGGGLPCDCGFEFDPVCVEDEDGNILFFPNLCWAECEGYTEDDLVDCEEPPVGDCIECLDEPFDPVCVETEPGIYCPFPNACYAECEGYTEDDFVDCDSIGIGGGGFDCIECIEEPIDPVCVEDENGVLIPFPNACFAECIGGFTSDDFVDCEGDGLNNDDNQFSNVQIFDGVEEMTLGKINLSPNPVSDKLTVTFNSNLNEDTRGTIRVTSIEGKEMLQLSVQVYPGENTIQIDATDYLSGIYLLSLETKEDLKTVKFVK